MNWLFGYKNEIIEPWKGDLMYILYILLLRFIYYDNNIIISLK